MPPPQLFILAAFVVILIVGGTSVIDALEKKAYVWALCLGAATFALLSWLYRLLEPYI